MTLAEFFSDHLAGIYEFSDTTIDGGTDPILDDCSIDEILFTNVVFEGCVFTYCNFTDNSFINCTFIDCKFLNCSFYSCAFVNILLDNTTILETDFDSCQQVVRLKIGTFFSNNGTWLKLDNGYLVTPDTSELRVLEEAFESMEDNEPI